MVRKKILIIVHHYPPHISGVGQVAHNQAKRLIEMGHEVTVISSETNLEEKSQVLDGVNVVRIKALNFSENWAAPFPIFSPELVISLNNHIRHSDIVHIHDSFYISSFFASVFAKLYKKPLLLTQHVAMISHPSKIIVAIQKLVYATTAKIIFKLSNNIFIFNNRIEDFLIAKGVPKEKLIMLFNGVDTNIFSPITAEKKREVRRELHLSLNKKIILFVGRFVHKKGFEKVINLRNSDFQIVCVGGDIPDQKLSDDIIFLGKVSQHSLAKIYQASDIFLLPSESEGFPLSVQEAMATGLPVITTDDPGYRQYNFDRKYMCLIDSSNEKIISETVYKIYKDEELLAKMSEYSLEYAEKYFNWSTVLLKLDETYDSLLTHTVPSVITSQKQKLIVVSPYFYPKIGGLENIAYTTARKLHESGQYDVSIISSNYDGTGHVHKKIDGMNVYLLPISFILSNTPINPLWYWHIKKIFRQLKPDLIHVHAPVPYIADMAVSAAGNIPVVLTYHSGSMRKNKFFLDIFIGIYEYIFLRAMFRKVQAIVAYSPEFIENELADFKDKTFYIAPGVDTERFTSKPLNNHTKIVMFVGRMEHGTKWKGVETLLFAIHEVAQIHTDVELHLVGNGDAIDYYRKMAEDLGISKNVIFRGPKLGSELAKAYHDANIVVLPSTSNAESFGMVLVEAMASGRPVIGSQIGGIPQLIENEQNGFLVSPGKPHELASAINLLLSNTKTAEKYAHASFIKSQQFSWDIQVEKYKKLFNTILQPKKLKVAIVSDSVYPYNKGGKEKRIYDISTRLAIRGYNVTVYCMKWWGKEKIIIKDGVKLYGISPYYPLYAGKRRSITEGLFFSLHCLKLFTKDFDIIEVDHIPHLVLFTVKLVCVLKRKKMIVTWHEVWGKKYWLEYLGFTGIIGYWVEKLSVKLPDVIISVSDHTTKALRHILGSKKEIITIPNGFDTHSIDPTHSKVSGADIIFAGRLLAHKNIDVLLKAVQILTKTHKDITVFIIGEGPERTRLEILAKELGIENRVTFKNFMEDYQELYATMQASKVFALPSTREGFGIVVLEANACGLPVVTISHPENAARELIVEGKNGSLSKLNVADLASAIDRTLIMKSQNSDYGRYIEKYNWDNLVSKIITVYE